jgi:hypothetical protein
MQKSRNVRRFVRQCRQQPDYGKVVVWGLG